MSIDYGRHAMENGSLPNRDPETGIRYGIVSLHDLNEFALESFEPIYPCSCPECESEFEPGTQPDDDSPCPTCGFVADDDDDWFGYEPIALIYEEEGYSLSLDEHNDVWIFRSPHTTSRWSHCSPCAPGAAHLSDGTSEDHGDDLAYCLGDEWYDNGKDE